MTRAVPADRLRRGHALARALVADGGVPVLLHGDLHPGNVLDGGTGAAADEVAALLALARPEDRSSYHSISCATKRRSV